MHLLARVPCFGTIRRFIIPSVVVAVDAVLVVATLVVLWCAWADSPHEPLDITFAVLNTLFIAVALVPFIAIWLPYVAGCWLLLLAFIAFCSQLGSSLYQFHMLFAANRTTALAITTVVLLVLLFATNAAVAVYAFRRKTNNELVVLLQRYHNYLQTENRHSVRLSRSIPEQSLLVIAELFRQNNLNLDGLVGQPPA